MLAPTSFNPVNVNNDPRAIPPPKRSQYSKCNIYTDVKQFRIVDAHAIQVSQTEHKTFRDFIFHLVYSQNLQSDLEKARVIFRWITAMNMCNISFQKVPKGSPEEVLLSFKNNKTTIAGIFETLCGYAGLHCVTLTGFAKGMDYRLGDKFNSTEYNHSWNAVLIDGNWYLVDSHWATRFLLTEHKKPEKLVYEYDDFYFLTDPELLIYTHFPQEEEWQLLLQPLTLAAFEDLPYVKSNFFKCGMYLVSHQKGVVHTQKGRMILTLGFMKPTMFTYTINFSDSREEMYQGRILKSFVLQETGDNQVTFIFRPPKSGSYNFTIFAKLLTEDFGITNVCTASAEYKVIVDQPSSDGAPFPVCSDTNWGPGVPVYELGLEPNYNNAVIPTTDGKVNLEFKKKHIVYLYCKLQKPGMTDEESERCISETYTDDRIIVQVNLPVKGEYGLEVYGNDPSKDGDTYTHICQYFVHYASPDEQSKAFYNQSGVQYLQGHDQKVDNGQPNPDTTGIKEKRLKAQKDKKEKQMEEEQENKRLEEQRERVAQEFEDQRKQREKRKKEELLMEDLSCKDNLAVLFDVIASKLNCETTALGIHLGLTQDEIDQIRQDNLQSSHEQNFQIIWQWFIRSAKRTDHIDEIKKNLAEIDRNDVIKLLDKFDLKEFEYKCKDDGDEMLTEIDCLLTAQKIENGVFKLLRFFGKDQHTLERIRSDFHGDLWEQALRMLTEWRKSTYPNCTRNKLCSGLTYVKREDSIHFLEQKWCKKS